MPRLGLFVLGILVLAASACGDTLPKQAARAEPVSNPPVRSIALPTILEADRLIAERHRLETAALAAPGAAIDRNGLIGRNRIYGKLISPRFQLGAGAALRVGLHNDRRLAINGFRAIEAATTAIAPDGEVVSIKPPDAPLGAELSLPDRASGAAFFMADACPALIALRASKDANAIAEPDRQKRVILAMDRGLKWLVRHSQELDVVDRRAPNRLLHDALAFHSCGVLTGNSNAQALASGFVGLALTQIRPDGVFVEKGGSDTTYQAVSVRLALDLLLTGYDRPDAQRLNLAWQSGAIWLGSRIVADGRIDSTGNTRTCRGGEEFLGTANKVWPAGVYGALVYPAEIASNDRLKAAAARLSAWARANPRTDPCFP